MYHNCVGPRDRFVSESSCNMAHSHLPRLPLRSSSVSFFSPRHLLPAVTYPPSWTFVLPRWHSIVRPLDLASRAHTMASGLPSSDCTPHITALSILPGEVPFLKLSTEIQPAVRGPLATLHIALVFVRCFQVRNTIL